MQDEMTRILHFAQWFQTQGDSRQLRANDPETFVCMAYIARSTLDRALGSDNRHSVRLTALCAGIPGTPEGQAANSPMVAIGYQQAARILRTAVFDRIRHTGGPRARTPGS
ncbi:hypothetical protein GN316_20965 [Xylophilus sp. Kf1]|nr:hypothetical protein [Xylophilus sp. Kf1]